ncbi:MAG: hypothetical protein ACFB5Z_18470 [Elainellaceae cyanobacterium]
MTNAFRLAIAWDLITTFLGMLIVLGSMGFIALGLSIVGTSAVGAFNFSTKAIWGRGGLRPGEALPLKIAWVVAIALDFWTSLACNAAYIALGKVAINLPRTVGEVLVQLNIGQLLIVLFVTILATISPMLEGYRRDRNPKVL